MPIQLNLLQRDLVQHYKTSASMKASNNKHRIKINETELKEEKTRKCFVGGLKMLRGIFMVYLPIQR